MSGVLTASQEIGLGPQPIPLCNNQKEEDQESRRALISSAFWVRLLPLVVYLEQGQLFLLPESSCVSETALKA